MFKAIVQVLMRSNRLKTPNIHVSVIKDVHLPFVPQESLAIGWNAPDESWVEVQIESVLWNADEGFFEVSARSTVDYGSGEWNEADLLEGLETFLSVGFILLTVHGKDEWKIKYMED